MKSPITLILCILLFGCTTTDPKPIAELLEDSPSINGKPDYLNSPYVTAGNRVYMVGHQDGTFPELGWHIKGEMGGIWNHPIKLMDGFEAKFILDNKTVPLDSASSFVNYPMANKHHYSFKEENLKMERWQFVPDNAQGIFVQYLITNTSPSPIEFMFEFTGYSDLRPTWLGERTDMVNLADIANFMENKWLVKDEGNPWFVVFGSDVNPSSHEQLKTPQEKTTSNSLTYQIDIAANETKTLNFAIAGSYQSESEAIEEYEAILNNYEEYALAKKERYATLASQSKLTIPDKDLQQAFEWLKYNCDWLVRTVPEIGMGIGAGIPDYPWWFGVDSEYALKGYMAIGQEAPVMSTIKLLDSVSNAVNGNGKIIHEMSTNGAVFNPGNINETPQFASLIWEIYQWNGDKQFLENYFSTIEKGLDWLLKENDANNNLFPDGFGMMEIHGLDSEMIDVAAYTQRAFEDASKIAAELDKKELSVEYAILAKTLKDKINTEFWSEEFNSYADFLGTDAQALHLIDDAIVRADTLNKPWAIEELEATKKRLLANPSKKLKPFVLHHNWVVNTPMEMGIADSSKALTALNTAKKFTNPFGVFVTGIDRDDSAGQEFGSFEGSKVFSYTGAVMTLPTGVQAIAENNYGRPDEALDYLKRMTRTFSYALPGSIYEVSPDYGMVVQAWNVYSFAIPIVQQFFGIRPQAQNKKIVIKPQMPSSWQNVSLENVRVADNEISMMYRKESADLNIELTQTNSDYTLQLELSRGDYQIVQGQGAVSTSGQLTTITSNAKKLVVSTR